MPDIVHFLLIEAPRDQIYKTVTEQKGLSGWWTEDTIAEPVVNSISEFKFGEEYHNKMKVTKLVENNLVEWECIHGDKEWIGTTFKFELFEEEGVSYLRFTHGNWQDATNFFGSCNYHWGLYMTSLKSYCESGIGTPFPKKKD